MTSRINGLCELTLLGHIVSEPKLAETGTSCAFQMKTTERWKGASHTEYHYCVLFNAKMRDFVLTHCPVGTLVHVKANPRYNSHNKRTDVLVRELRRVA